MAQVGRWSPRGIDRRAFTSSLLASAAAWALSSTASRSDAGKPVFVAAASSFRFILPDLIASFEGGERLRPVYGSSGNFVRQIEAGAPFDLFLSADLTYAVRLESAGLLGRPARVLADGRLVLFAPEASDVVPEPDLKNLHQAVLAGTVNRIAIANPEHAPYGARAKQALKSAGLWSQLWDARRIALAGNVAEALKFATTGRADAAFVAKSLQLARGWPFGGRFAQVSTDLYTPTRHAVAVRRTAPEFVREFADYLFSPKARVMLRNAGLEPR